MNVSSFEQLHLHLHAESYSDYYDSVYVFKWLEFIGPVLTFPILSAIAFLFNLIVILVINSKKNQSEDLFKARMFRYISINSAFNCLECLIYELRLINICIFPGSIYCSSIRSTSVSLFIGVYVTGYLSEAFKTCSMITGLLFSIERYLDTSKSRSKLLNFSTNFKSSRGIILTITASSLILSAFKLIEPTFVFNKSFIYDSPPQFTLNSYQYVSFGTFYKLSTYFYFFHYIFNDLVILIMNMFIDIKLVVVVRRDIKQKLAFQTSSSQSRLKLLQKKEKIIKKTNSMILVNLVLYLFCRLPELGSHIFFYVYHNLKPSDHQKVLKQCSDLLFCYLLANSIEYLYMLAYLFNILIYYKFNSNFRIGFGNLFGLKRSIEDKLENSS